MIKNLYFYYNEKSTNPHETLALEEYFLNNISKNECILYLYSHKDSVIIGKNQNARIECKYGELSEDLGTLARRISGGGAVFHDLGNLNFSFITHKDNYDLQKNLQVIIDGVNSFGIKAEFSGRNDIMVGNRKFSGNAFCHRKDGIFHHGTILIDTNLDKLTHYLNVPLEKIESKGISSVRSRVVNLSELSTEITVTKMIEALKTSFAKNFGEFSMYPSIDDAHIKSEEFSKRNKGWDFIFGMTPKFDINIKKRFSWGEIELFMELADAAVYNAYAYSDCLDADLIEEIANCLVGQKFISSSLSNAVKSLKQNESNKHIIADVSNFILDQKY